jgi:hypothetical protein
MSEHKELVANKWHTAVDTYGCPFQSGGGHSPCRGERGRCGHQSSHANHSISTTFETRPGETYLRLEDVRRDDLRAVAIEERERSAERRSGDTPEDSLSDDSSPAGLRVVDSLVEEVVEEQGLELVVLLVGLGDIVQEDRLPNRVELAPKSDQL